jgi:hypothetical protein
METPGAYRVEERSDELGFVGRADSTRQASGSPVAVQTAAWIL